MKRGVLRYLVLVPLGMATAGLGMCAVMVTLMGMAGLGAGSGSGGADPETVAWGLAIAALAVLCGWTFRKLLPVPPDPAA